MDEKKKTCMDSGGPGLMTDGELGMFPGNSDLNDRDYCDYHKKKSGAVARISVASGNL